MTRRIFLAGAAAAPLAAAGPKPALCLFSKHAPKLNYEELGRTVRAMGFDGVDLTVRPSGHVLPERAAADLPRAIETIRGHGLAVPMITTGITSASDAAARPILSTAGRLKVPFWKPGYWRYRGPDIEKTVSDVKQSVTALVELSREYGVAVGLHNHSGDYVGQAVWDNRAILTDLDPRWAGYYFDPCHATIEGGAAGWKIALDLALKRIKMVAVKDFYWEKHQGRWRIKYCPLGEGMVDWGKFLAGLAGAGFSGPLSLHLEYEPPDEMAAIARDLEFLKKRVAAAYAV